VSYFRTGNALDVRLQFSYLNQDAKRQTRMAVYILYCLLYIYFGCWLISEGYVRERAQLLKHHALEVRLVPAIEAHSLTRKFGELAAVENLDLAVSEGEILAFLGPNGAGKTTTIRMLAGIISPTSGYAVVAGHRTDTEVEKLHQVIGLLTETPGLYDRLSARHNLEYFAGFYPALDGAIQAEKYLRVVGLEKRAGDRVGTFSKGMKQRLALARALLPEPRVLFLDEPTSGLDPEVASEVRELIKSLGSEGRTIFLSTHNLAEAEQICGRIAIISTRLLALDTPQNLRQRLFRHEIVIELESISSRIMEMVNGLSFVLKVTPQGDQILVELSDPQKNRPELVKSIVDAGGRIISVSERRHSLEEVYLNLIHEGGDGNT
jgi:ABC-2 type transport system ATP-binding protein